MKPGLPPRRHRITADGLLPGTAVVTHGTLDFVGDSWQDVRVDLLTPARKSTTAPVFIRRLNAVAIPLKYLEYLIEKPIRAVMLAGTPCLVSLPQPARFALHKLILSQERDASAADKRRKDLVQAASLIALFKDERPGELDLARSDLVKRGVTWQKKLAAACAEARIEL